MQALKRWARRTLILVTMERPDWDEWWEGFEEYNPISAHITEEFWRKFRRKLRRLERYHAVGRCSGAEIKLYENYYARRVYELRRDREPASLFQD